MTILSLLSNRLHQQVREVSSIARLRQWLDVRWVLTGGRAAILFHDAVIPLIIPGLRLVAPRCRCLPLLSVQGMILTRCQGNSPPHHQTTFSSVGKLGGKLEFTWYIISYSTVRLLSTARCEGCVSGHGPDVIRATGSNRRGSASLITRA